MKKIIDFNNSYSLIAFDHNNVWRQKIISKAIIYDNNEKVLEELYLNHACLSEHVYTENLMLEGRFTWQAIISNDELIVLRNGNGISTQFTKFKKDNLKEATIIKNEKNYESVELHDLPSLLVVENNSDLICETSYKLENIGVHVKIYYPANYINFHAEEKKIQIDVGPVIFLNDNDKLSLINNVVLSYCCFSNVNQMTEFNSLESRFIRSGLKKSLRSVLNIIVSKIPFSNEINRVGYTKNNKVEANNKVYKSVS